MRLSIVFFAVFLMFASLPVSAQEADPDLSQPQAEGDKGYDERLALAQKLQELRPVRDQVNIAITQIAQSRPEEEREGFKSAMRNAFNVKAIEKISINAYAETFTAEELKVLIEYHSNPVAVSAAEKMEAYTGIVYPELVKMLDKAAMRARTGQ